MGHSIGDVSENQLTTAGVEEHCGDAARGDGAIDYCTHDLRRIPRPDTENAQIN